MHMLPPIVELDSGMLLLTFVPLFIMWLVSSLKPSQAHARCDARAANMPAVSKKRSKLLLPPGHQSL
jgi:hypothetical protein